MFVLTVEHWHELARAALTPAAPMWQDAMRYRHIRDANMTERCRLDHYAGPALDVAIDAAFAPTPPEQK